MALISIARGTYAKVSAAERNDDTLYFATDRSTLYLGNNLISSEVKDATFAGKVLTITKTDSSKITLDFNDVASAEGVNSLLATLRTDINKNKTDIATLQGQVTANKVSAADKSIDVTGSKIKVNISSTAGNKLSLDANGLFVPTPAAYTGSNAIKVSGQAISLALDGKSLTQSATGLKSTLQLKAKADIDSSLASVYQLVDASGNVYGDEIEIVKDQFLKSVTLDASDNLVFVFETTSGETTSKVNIAKYIDTYTAGNGITVASKVISAKVKSGDAYLTVDANGIASKGIDSAISTAVTNASTAWNTKLNNAKAEIDASIDALQASVANPMVYAADGTTIDSSVVGKKTTFSVKTNVFDAYGAASTVKTQLTGTASDASTAITIYGVKNYAKAYADSVVNSAKSTLIGASGDASTASTIWGSKNYAKAVADAAQAAAISAAATDATTKDNAVKTALIGTASDASTASTIYGAKKAATDAASAAQTAATNAAKTYTDAQVSAAKTAAATDATTKANNALASAKAYTDEKLTWIEL